MRQRCRIQSGEKGSKRQQQQQQQAASSKIVFFSHPQKPQPQSSSSLVFVFRLLLLLLPSSSSMTAQHYHHQYQQQQQYQQLQQAEKERGRRERKTCVVLCCFRFSFWRAPLFRFLYAVVSRLPAWPPLVYPCGAQLVVLALLFFFLLFWLLERGESGSDHGVASGVHVIVALAFLALETFLAQGLFFLLHFSPNHVAQYRLGSAVPSCTCGRRGTSCRCSRPSRPVSPPRRRRTAYLFCSCTCSLPGSQADPCPAASHGH